jgi:hypothetical protein
MAELLFFATDLDHALIVQDLVSNYGATFVVDGSPFAAITEFSNPAEVLNSISISKYGRRLCVVSPRWQLEPIQRSEAKRQNGASSWYVNRRYGGPSLDYIAKREVLGDHGHQIVPSSIGTFSTYYLSAGELPRTPELQGAFSVLRKLVQRGKRSVSVETGESGPRVMPGALNSFFNGSWLRVGESRYVPAET